MESNDNNTKANDNNLLVYIVRNGFLRDIFWKTKHSVVLFKNINRVNKQLFQMTKRYLADDTLLHIPDDQNIDAEMMFTTHKHVKCSYYGTHNTINNLQKKFNHINTLEIVVEIELIQRMIVFNEEGFKQLHTLTIDGSVEMLDVTSIPSNVKTLILKNDILSPSLPKTFMSMLPDTLQTLVILFKFKGYLTNFPASLKNLLINGVNYELGGVENLNDNLVKLSLGDKWFDYMIVSVPPNLTHFRLGMNFNGNIDILQTTKITHLAFGDKFNQSVNNLPSQLEWVEFGARFNQPVDEFPSTLGHVCFCWDFNQSIDKLPSSIKFLRIHSGSFRQILPNWPNLVVLDINTPSCTVIMTALPETLEVLKVETSVLGQKREHYDFANLPKLRKLYIDGEFSTSLYNVLPNTLTHLILGDHYNQPLSYLPTSLRYLRIGASFQYINVGHRSVCHLKLVTHKRSEIGKRMSGAASNIFGEDITLNISDKIHDVTKSYRSDPFICKEFISC